MKQTSHSTTVDAARIRCMFEDVEQLLQTPERTRLLISLPEPDLSRLLFLCLEQFSQAGKRLLLLTSATMKPVLIHRWQQARSPKDGPSFSQTGSMMTQLTLPLSGEARICIAHLREVQYYQRSEPERLAQAFDMTLTSALPARPSALWQQVLEHLEGNLIGFTSEPVPTMKQAQMFTHVHLTN
jgi:hypothetical protein